MSLHLSVRVKIGTKGFFCLHTDWKLVKIAKTPPVVRSIQTIAVIHPKPWIVVVEFRRAASSTLAVLWAFMDGRCDDSASVFPAPLVGWSMAIQYSVCSGLTSTHSAPLSPAFHFLVVYLWPQKTKLNLIFPPNLSVCEKVSVCIRKYLLIFHNFLLAMRGKKNPDFQEV